MENPFLRFWAPPYPKEKMIITVVFIVIIYWFVPPVWRLNDDKIFVSQVSRDGKIVDVLMGPKTESWVEMGSVARCFPQAIITAEDALFYSHHGFDFESIKKNIAYNWRKKKFVRGGSTISQQLVKIAFLSNERSLVRKAREAVGTLIMEVMISKEKILTWYMNLVELGSGIYGVKAGAKKYFGKSPKNMNLSECVQLALVLPSPVKWSQSLRNKSLTPFAKKRFEGILTNMLRSGHISKSNWEDHMMRGNFGLPVRVVIKPPEPTEDTVDLSFPDEEEDVTSRETPLFLLPGSTVESSADSDEQNFSGSMQPSETPLQDIPENLHPVEIQERQPETDPNAEDVNKPEEYEESSNPEATQ